MNTRKRKLLVESFINEEFFYFCRIGQYLIWREKWRHQYCEDKSRPEWPPPIEQILYCRLLLAISCQIKVQLYQTIKQFLSLSGDIGIGLVWDNPSPYPNQHFDLSVEIFFKLNLANCDGFILSGDHFKGVLVAIGKPLVEAFLSYFGSWLEYHGQYAPNFRYTSSLKTVFKIQ